MEKMENSVKNNCEQSVLITIYVCTECGYKFSSKSSLNFHMKSQHDNFISLNKGKICPLCKNKVATFEELDKHIVAIHQLSIKDEKKDFSSLDEFNSWKESFEKETKSSYVFSNSVSRHGKKYTYYVCHRSGYYKLNLQKSERQRALKLNGTNKINATCPARIKSVEDSEGHISVYYIQTHVGHEFEVGKLRLTLSERQELAGKQLQGIQNHRILKDISKKFDADKRVSYTTNHDLHNIKKSFNVQSDVIFHNDDAKSVDILVEKYKNTLDSPILEYKPYGTKHDLIGEKNFFLIFMNSAQQEMLIKHGNDILMIDSTHDTNPYKIQLTTLMVVDSDLEGFPVAFLWSITQTEAIFQSFFCCIKEKIPELKPRIFMSDDANAFFNAFVKVYNWVLNKILCDWHVKKNLTENLSKIVNTQKRKEVKKEINVLIDELDLQTFNMRLSTTLQKWLNTPETTVYGQYFMKYYAKRPEQWAHCHRKGFRRNTNMCLEKWHQELKHNSVVRGKFQQRLDVSINNVIECLRMKFMKRLVYLSRSKVPHKLSELRKRHKIAQQIVDEVHIIEELPNSKWHVASTKNNLKLLEYYSVSLDESYTQCNCHFLCNDCNVCLHKFSCTCHDYMIQYNMCKHIHLVGIKYCAAQLLVNPTQNLQLLQEQESKESSFICRLMKETAAPSTETAKNLALEKISALRMLILESENLEVITYASDNITSTISGVKALQSQELNTAMTKISHSSNANIQHQKRLQPLERKQKKRKIKNNLEESNLFFPNVLQK